MDKEQKQLAVFGYGLSLILTVWTFLLWRKGSYFWFFTFLLAMMFVVLTRAHHKLLKSIYVKWMIVAHAIGHILTTVVLTMIFYFVFTPIGLILRILRKDLLERAWSASEKSYWKKKETAFDRERYLKQF